MSSVVAVGDSLTVTFNRPMLQIGEGSGVEMSGNYQLDSRALPRGAKIASGSTPCRSRFRTYGTTRWTGLPRMFTSHVVTSCPDVPTAYSIFHQPGCVSPGGVGAR